MKSPVQIALAAAGVSIWIPHDYWQTPPAITLAGFVSNGATLTWAVQYTCDDIYDRRPIRISQTTTVITVTDYGPNLKSAFGVADGPFGHGLVAGDWYKITGTGIAGVDGEYSVTTIVDANNITLTSAISQSVTAVATGQSGRVFTHAVLTGQNGRANSNYQFPIRASRLQITAYTSGTAYLEALQGGTPS